MIEEVDVDTLEGVLANNAVLVDVRMPDEFDEQRVPGALLIPLPELLERYGEIPEISPVYVICRSGARSYKACEFLESKGLQARNVRGGTMAWAESGRRTDSGPIEA